MTEQIKKVVNVEILHLDEFGYGPEGKHTRREWRAECLENLLAGKEQFEAWQFSWLNKIDSSPWKNYSIKVIYDGGDTTSLFDLATKVTLDFSGCNLDITRIFSEYKFLIHTNFNMVSFQKDAFFDNVIFKSGVSFDNAVFKEGAYFREAICETNEVRFTNVVFDGVVSFYGVTFHKIVYINNTIFNDAALFQIANFNEMVVFTNSEFRSHSIFLDAKFEDHSDFENVTFSNVGHFEGARFLKLFPAFRGCNIDATRLEFSDDSYFPQDDFSEDAIKNISFLKRLSDEHGQTDQALNFNAMELRAKRKSNWEQLQSDPFFLKLIPFLLWRLLVKSTHIFNGKFWFCVFTWAYEQISDFGRSFTRPLFFLVILLCISYLFGIAFAFENSPAHKTHTREPIFSELSRVYNYQYLKPSLSAYRAATEYSLYRSGNFLDFTDSDKNTASINMRLFGNEIEPWWARVFGFVKGIFTAILFLIALGLRNKYRVS
jgi:uncharacterized protein YjbI with pentapeptide repeats